MGKVKENSDRTQDALIFGRVIFMEDHIPIRPDRSLLGRQTFKWSLWDVVFHENNSISTDTETLSIVLW